MSTDTTRYGRLAAVYDTFTRWYSFGLVRRTTQAQIAQMGPGTKVLYAGCGTAEDALAAASEGAEVTAIDLSAAMVRRARARIAEAGLDNGVQLLQGDIMEHEETYDIVVANYFLNVFDESTSQRVLAHLCSLVRPDGAVFLADFETSATSGWARWVQFLYPLWAYVGCFLVAGNAVHAPYDYRSWLTDRGFTRQRRQSFSPTKGLPPLFATLEARR
jgi:demethylphylloquinol methyltransferase